MNKNKAQAIVLILLAGFFFSLMTFFVRLSGDLPTMQKVFFRNLVAVLVATVILFRSPEGFRIKKTSIPGITMRCLAGTAGVICNFYAISHIGLADSNILNKLAPFFAMILSYFVLKEKPSRVEWATVVVAFIGAIFVVKPSFEMTAFYGFIGVLGGLGAGTAYTYVRKLGKLGERGPVIVFCFSLFSCLVSLPYLLLHYCPMSTGQLLCLLLAGAAASGGQFTITAAYQKAPAKEISVFDYSQILFASLWGILFLSEVPDLYSIIGYVIIIACAVFKWWYAKRSPNVKSSTV